MKTKTDRIAITYKDIEIVYYDDDNQWVFTLRGRERRVESLLKAKEAIDRPAPSPKEETPFKPIQAYMSRWHGQLEVVTVTSIAAPRASWDTSQYVWVTTKEGRRKARVDSVYPCSEENKALANKIGDLVKQIDALTKQRDAAADKLKPIKL